MEYIGRSFDETEGFIPETSGPVNYKPAAGLEFLRFYGDVHFCSSITRRPAAILSKKWLAGDGRGGIGAKGIGFLGKY
jgi:hypothetical protein